MGRYVAHLEHGGSKEARGVGGDVGGGDKRLLARDVEACISRSRLAFRCGPFVEQCRPGVEPVGDEHARCVSKLSGAGSNLRRAAGVAHVIVDDQNAAHELSLLNRARVNAPFAGTRCGHHPLGSDVIVSRGKVGRRILIPSSEVRRLVYYQPSRESEPVRDQRQTHHIPGKTMMASALLWRPTASFCSACSSQKKVRPSQLISTRKEALPATRAEFRNTLTEKDR